MGALVVFVAVQVFVPGLYLPPVLNRWICHLRPKRSFRSGPDCRVDVAASGRVGCARGYPTVRARIVSAAGVEIADAAAPPQMIISLPVQTAV